MWERTALASNINMLDNNGAGDMGGEGGDVRVTGGGGDVGMKGPYLCLHVLGGGGCVCGNMRGGRGMEGGI